MAGRAFWWWRGLAWWPPVWPTADVVLAFDLLPQAALLVARDGAIQHLNAAALLLLGAAQRVSLATALGDDMAAEDILTRVAAAGTVSLVQGASRAHWPA